MKSKKIYKKRWLGIPVVGGTMKEGYVLQSRWYSKKYYKKKRKDKYGLINFCEMEKIEEATVFNDYREIAEELAMHQSGYSDGCKVAAKTFFAYGIEIIHVEYEVDGSEDV